MYFQSHLVLAVFAFEVWKLQPNPSYIKWILRDCLQYITKWYWQKKLMVNERTWPKEVFAWPALVEFSCQDNLAHIETKYQHNMVALFAE